MNLRITEDKKVEIEMEAQLMETIEAFGEELEGEVTSPVQHHIFDVNKDSELLNENNKKIFTA